MKGRSKAAEILLVAASVAIVVGIGLALDDALGFGEVGLTAWILGAVFVALGRVVGILRDGRGG